MNRTNLLRVHRPEEHDDLINRPILLEAEKTGSVVAGLERGRVGTFVLNKRIEKWDQYPDVVVVDRTLATLPAEVHALLATKGFQPDAPMERVTHDRRELQVIYLPLHGLNQETLGELIVLRDITDSVAAGRAAVTLVKGAVKTVCMNRAAAFASDLESLGKSGNLAGAESICAQLEKESAPLLPSIRSARADESVTE